MTFTAILPMPPTANNLFPTSRSGHRFPSKAYTAWKRVAAEYFTAEHKKAPQKMTGRIRARYEFCFSDKRRRDVANFEKAVTDFLVAQGVIGDDCQIDDFQLVRRPISKKAFVYAQLTEITEDACP